MRRIADRVLICFVILFLLIPLAAFNFAKNQHHTLVKRLQRRARMRMHGHL